jgi:hypothetical protein
MTEWQQELYELTPGYILLTTIRAGLCGTFTLLSHSGVVVTKRGQAIRLRGSAVTSLKFAFYSTSVAATGWQPCDQATPAAYLPFRYEALDSFAAAGGVLLLQKASMTRDTPCDIRAITDGHQRLLIESNVGEEDVVRETLAALLRRAGAADAAAYSRMIVARLEAHSIHSAA